MDSSDPWLQLDAELDAWVAAGKLATVWWRDDDAVRPGPMLTQLVELTRVAGLLLAVIPEKAESSLATSLGHSPHVLVAQHGYAHINHAPRGRGLGAWELGLHRGMDAVLADLDEGRHRLEELFGSSFFPIVVPPWNRIAPELFTPLAERGYLGVSAFGSREPDNGEPDNAQADLLIANAHCDPIRWKSGAAFAGEGKTLLQLVTHLEARRTGQVPILEHTGFLTHHIDLDDAGWAFCARLAIVIDSHAGGQWISPASVFGKPS